MKKRNNVIIIGLFLFISFFIMGVNKVDGAVFPGSPYYAGKYQDGYVGSKTGTGETPVYFEDTDADEYYMCFYTSTRLKGFSTGTYFEWDGTYLVSAGETGHYGLVVTYIPSKDLFHFVFMPFDIYYANAKAPSGTNKLSLWTGRGSSLTNSMWKYSVSDGDEPYPYFIYKSGSNTLKESLNAGKCPVYIDTTLDSDGLFGYRDDYNLPRFCGSTNSTDCHNMGWAWNDDENPLPRADDDRKGMYDDPGFMEIYTNTGSKLNDKINAVKDKIYDYWKNGAKYNGTIYTKNPTYQQCKVSADLAEGITIKSTVMSLYSLALGYENPETGEKKGLNYDFIEIFRKQENGLDGNLNNGDGLQAPGDGDAWNGVYIGSDDDGTHSGALVGNFIKKSSDGLRYEALESIHEEEFSELFTTIDSIQSEFEDACLAVITKEEERIAFEKEVADRKSAIVTMGFSSHRNGPSKIEGCPDFTATRFYGYLQSIFLFVRITVPILTFALIVKDFVTAVAAGNEDGVKKAQKHAVARLVIGVIIFLLPTVVNLLINILISVGGLGSDICGV